MQHPRPCTLSDTAGEEGEALTQQRPKRLRVLVLVGLVGSGKSTFAKALCKHDPSYTRSSQDVLGSRQAVESHLLSLLSRGQNPVIDRTNVTIDQRGTWLRLALDWQKGQEVQAATGSNGGQMEVEVNAIYFQTGLEKCNKRLMGRQDHETIHSPQQAIRVLHAFASQLRPPSTAEGFHKVLVITPVDFASADPSEEEVQRILQRLEEMPESHQGGTRGALMSDMAHRNSRTARRGDSRGGRSYEWGATDRGRGGRGGGARGGKDRGRGGSGPERGRTEQQGQPTLTSLWATSPPAGETLPPRPG